MIDLQTLDYDSETLVERFGAFEQVTDRPVALSTRASSTETAQRVVEFAADKGCDLVLMGPVETRTKYSGGGVLPGAGAAKYEAAYQLFRMGYRLE